MVGEVRRLLEHVPAEDLIYYGLEYKYLTLYVLGQLSYDEMAGKDFVINRWIAPG